MLSQCDEGPYGCVFLERWLKNALTTAFPAQVYSQSVPSFAPLGMNSMAFKITPDMRARLGKGPCTWQ